MSAFQKSVQIYQFMTVVSYFICNNVLGEQDEGTLRGKRKGELSGPGPD